MHLKLGGLGCEMKELPSLERLQELFDYNSGKGLLLWKKPTKLRIKAGMIAGTKNAKGYLNACVDARSYMVHRLIWLYHYGKPPENSIDHINGVRHDNRICNLRDVSNTVNTENQKRATSQNRSSGALGVSREKKHRRWRAVIETKGKQIHIGYYDTIEEAQTAYINKKRQLHTGCTL
jgi:hypothetical protein